MKMKIASMLTHPHCLIRGLRYEQFKPIYYLIPELLGIDDANVITRDQLEMLSRRGLH